jgi:transposase InsO family protein
VAENLLEQRFEAAAPSQAWLSDLTYVPTDEGWLYLVGHRDLCSRKIVGYAMGERMTKNLVMESLLRAVETTKSLTGLVHHSDKGSQYCSHEYRRMLEGLGIKASMSATGNCFDNAPMESFWATLKTELVFHRRFVTRQQAIREITEYIEVFYNRQRIQKQLGYLSPVAFEHRYHEQRLAA